MIWFNATLLQFDKKVVEIPLKPIDMSNKEYQLIIELLKEIKDLPQIDGETIQSYTYGIAANIETKESLKHIDLRVDLRADPQTYNLYLRDGGFYKASPKVEKMIKDIFSNNNYLIDIQTEHIDKQRR